MTFKTAYCLMQVKSFTGQKYCRMLQKSILQYFRPSLSYHLPLRPLFCLFLSGRSRQVLLYVIYTRSVSPSECPDLTPEAAMSRPQLLLSSLLDRCQTLTNFYSRETPEIYIDTGPDKRQCIHKCLTFRMS